MMRVLVTGANGQLGFDVCRQLGNLGIDFLGTTKENLDITDSDAVRDLIIKYHPDCVIHCAAYTAVDRAEDDKEVCHQVNVLGTRYIAEACKEVDATMVYISTDYVFDGEGNRPFEVTDKPNPVNYYGLTKYEGELEVQRLLTKYFIVRISWVFGVNGNNFVKTMLRLGKQRDEVSVVCDQFGSPTYTADLSLLITDMIQTDSYGIYHATNEGFCSWYQFVLDIYQEAGVDAKVIPIQTNEYPTRAMRPKNSRLSKKSIEKFNYSVMRDYRDAIRDYLKEIIA